MLFLFKIRTPPSSFEPRVRAIKTLHGELQDKEVKWLGKASIGNTAAWSGALIGAWSHLLLDSFMHEDIKPFSPFTDANPLLGVISVGNFLKIKH